MNSFSINILAGKERERETVCDNRVRLKGLFKKSIVHTRVIEIYGQTNVNKRLLVPVAACEKKKTTHSALFPHSSAFWTMNKQNSRQLTNLK